MRKTLFIILFFIIYYLMIRYMFFVLLPFIFALLFYLMMKPMILSLENIFHIQRSTIGMILLLCFYLIIIVSIVFGITYIIGFIVHYVQDIPYFYQNMIEPLIQELIMYLQQHFAFLFRVTDFSFIQTYSGEYIMRIMSFVSLVLTKLPSFLFSLFIFMIATFFLFIEYDMIKEKMNQLCSSSFLKQLSFIKEKCFLSIKCYIKCQGILMIFCFSTLWIGFLILKMNHPFFMALIIAWFDSLPFIGVGIALIPLMLIALFQGLYIKAIYLFLLYVFIVFIRSLLEPKIMKQQMKVPSFILLFSMMIHLYLFGVVGVILSPLHVNLFYSYIDSKNND